ncbi:hypothetical protein TRIUR3_01810 [Triticum urartu]|uniref:Uncharacterized protein n=1 Tax=Triticum urartu TaxID=4572 RepID=M7ZHP7_TRIUA|nr:hypothetical protein TRIUR3_01810 [Triticum urartu]
MEDNEMERSPCFKELHYVEAKILTGPYKRGSETVWVESFPAEAKILTGQSVGGRILTRCVELSKFKSFSKVY